MISVMRVRSVATSLAIVGLFAVSAAGCASSPQVAFSCTDDGVAKTRLISEEIADALGGARPTSSAGHGFSHGCDSTPHGVYDFLAIDRDAIAAAFGCRPDESLSEGWKRCSAAHGPFSLSAETATIEVLP
jgi:hypothetical protein